MRQATITSEYKRELYAYILGIVRNLNCTLIRINGLEDHVHMLVDLHPSISLADFVREVKSSSSKWLKENNKFPQFIGWRQGYYAYSLHETNIESCKQYIINQEIHHQSRSTLDEAKWLALLNNLRWDERDWK
ncbi:MAG: IS200/IS605 family transposase [Muribaculaceae bacterium]|nr:IS200/IS605 family transposase [Muribaculaceae bacterium]